MSESLSDAADGEERLPAGSFDRLEREVRHDMRSNLNQIIGYSDLLIDEAEQRGFTDLIPDLRRIHVAGLRLLKLINQHVDPVTRRADNVADPIEQETDKG